MTFFSISHLAAESREFEASIEATDAGLTVTETYMGGIKTGNSDLGVPEYVPYSGPRERAPLPGEEHKSALKSRTWRDA